MTWMERFEEMREHLFHPHREDMGMEKRQTREQAEQAHHHVDQSTGSEFLDVM